jgi:hypothetical protein
MTELGPTPATPPGLTRRALIASAIALRTIGLSQASAESQLEKVLTWDGASAALANGVIGFIGGKVLEQLFKRDEVDLVQLVAAFAEQVKKIVRQELRIDDHEKLVAQLRAMQGRLHDYANDPTRTQLELLHADCRNLVEEARRLRILAVPEYALAGSSLLVVFEEKWKRGGKAKGPERNLVEGAAYLVKGVDEFPKSLAKQIESRFSAVTSYRLSNKRHGAHHYRYEFDGEFRMFQRFPEAEARRAAEIRDVYEKADRDLLTGLYMVRDLWKQVAMRRV